MIQSSNSETTAQLVADTNSKKKNFGLVRIIATLIGLALIISSSATVAVLAGYAPWNSDITTVVWLLNLDLVLALTLIAVIARRIVVAWMKRRQGSDGATLHIRLVASFSLVAVIPALLVAVFSGLFLNFGIESWFSDRVRTAINQSKLVAEAYLHEHKSSISGAALGMANDINRAARSLLTNPRILAEIMHQQSVVRGLSEAVVVDSRGNTLARAGFGFSLGFNFSSDDLVRDVLNKVPGEVIIIGAGRDDRVLAGVKLEAFTDAYLLVGRYVKKQVLDHLSRTRGATAQYLKLEMGRESLKLKFLLIFGMVAVILLLVAIWIGWSLATQLSTPIGKLIDAAERVRKGDLDARVTGTDIQSEDEIGALSRAFNKMTEQLNNQRNGLIDANRQLDERRQFTEAVLAGVSAGVIGLDNKGNILVHNRSASDLLNLKLQEHVGLPLGVVVPPMEELMTRTELDFKGIIHSEIKHFNPTGQKTLVVSIAVEKINREVIGYVVTFDDVTELLSAQRKAAWADVARRIAHEIKNPLTPIQLSAERLHRKYSGEIISDKEIFQSCTDTIIRQVKGIGKMVDEFSSFARMPQPQLKPIDLTEICSQIGSLEKTRFPEIEYDLNIPKGEVRLYGDRQQIGQVLTNLLKNAAESIDSRFSEDTDSQTGGRICLDMEVSKESVKIYITDNGEGLPSELLDRITEPYVTTRQKGTGLGLAIAKKIMEDHNGDLILVNNEGTGAKAIMMFNKSDFQS